MNQLRTEIRDRVGVLTLDRPRAINALTKEMLSAVTAVLTDWATDEAVAQVELRGAGERGLCSGADVVGLREMVLRGEDYLEFFEIEYRLNQLIVDYPKPYVAYMSGITMGGGLGISAHGSHRIADATSRFAMPETIIGFEPDVGLLWLLARAPGETGTHLALTGTTIGAADGRYVGLVDEVVGEVPAGSLARDRDWIDECYVGDSAIEILGRLESHPQEAARAAAAVLNQRCPLSVAVTLAAIRRAAKMTTVAEVLAQDRQLAERLIPGPDFVEGVRAQLVDKDRQPKWQHASLAEVSRAEVLACFED